jgi:branched-chain amino acid transport system permease protein
VPYVAHPSFLVLGAYATYLVAGQGVDPILAGLLLTPVFFVLGLGIYQFYYLTFESRGTDTGLRGIAFFFGIAFIVQVALILAFGVDQRLVDADYIGSSYELARDQGGGSG